jgi:hypothetical protein
MHPTVRRDLAGLGQLDHVRRRRETRNIICRCTLCFLRERLIGGVLANERNASTGQRNARDSICRRDVGRWAAVYRKQAADGNEPAPPKIQCNPGQDTLVRAVEDARRILGGYIERGPHDSERTVERL